MSRKVRENILVPTLDKEILPSGTEIFIKSKNRKGPLINGEPGRIVFFDPRENVALGAADLNKADHGTVVIGVLTDTTGDGVADTIRRPFGDMIYGCNIEKANVKKPECGVSQIKDFMFKCTETNRNYGLSITVEDENTQKRFSFNRPAIYNYNIKVNTESCSGCTVEDASRKVACNFADAINETVWNQDPTKQGRIMPLDKIEKSFEAVPLYANEYVFCISPVATECKDCAYVPGILGLNLDGEDDITFTHTTVPNPDGGTFTTKGQIEHVVFQINEALGEFGHAVVTKGPGTCCEYQLMINTCKTVTTLQLDGEGTLAPCSTSSPLDPVPFEEKCKDCGEEDGTLTFISGIRVIAKPVSYTDNCNMEDVLNQPVKYYGREINIFPEDGFTDATWHKRTVQEMVLPDNLGYEWLWREYASATGGSGRDYNPYNNRYGSQYRPGKNDRIRGVSLKCEANYCSYSIDHNIPHAGSGGGRYSLAQGRTIVLINSTFDTLRASFEAALNAYITDGTCGVLAPLECIAEE